MDRNPHAADLETLLRHRAWLRALIGEIVRDEATRDDVEQETWLFLARFKEPIRDLRALVKKIARGLALNSLRDSSQRRVGDAKFARMHEGAAAAGPDDLLARAEIERRVLGFVLELDEPYRRTLLLRFFEDLEHGEIAAQMNVPAATVRSRVHRGLALLRARLDGTDGQGIRDWRAVMIPALGSRVTKIAALAAATVGATFMRWKMIGGATALIVAAAGLVLWQADAPRAMTKDEAATARFDSPHVADDRVVVEPPVRVEVDELRVESKATPATATLAGRVLFAGSKRPVAGATISFVDPYDKKGPIKIEGSTASDGAYRVAGIPPDRSIHYIVASPSMLPCEREITIPGSGEQVLDISIEETESIRGRVVDAVTNEPIARATIRVARKELPTTSFGKRDLKVESDSAGNFAADVPAVALRSHGINLWAGAPGYALTSCPDYASVITGASPGVVPDVPLFRACRFEGSVRVAGGAALEDASVGLRVTAFDSAAYSARRGADHFDIETSTGNTWTSVRFDGTYVLEGISPFVRGNLGCEARGCFGRVEAFESTGSDAARRIDFELTSRGGNAVLEGRLTYNGKTGPIPYTLFVNHRPVGSKLKAKEDGSYRHEGLEAGEASIQACVPGIASKSESITLVGESTNHLDVDIQSSTSWVGGTVLLPDKTPAAGMALSLRSVAFDWLVGVNTDSAGRFRVFTGVAAGEFVIARVQRGGYMSEQRILGGNENAEFVLPAVGHVRLRIVDSRTRAPVLTPSIRVRRDGGDAPIEIADNGIHALPGDVVAFDIAAGTYEFEIDRMATFYAPVRVLATAEETPMERLVELPEATTGLARIEFAGGEEGPRFMPGTALYWRQAGDPSPAQRVAPLAILRATTTLVEVVLPAGSIEIGFGPGKGAERMLPAVEIVAGGAPAVVRFGTK